MFNILGIVRCKFLLFNNIFEYVRFIKAKASVKGGYL